MTETPSLETALRRLGTALSHLEEAAERRALSPGEEGGAELGQAELVHALEASRARADRLDAANREVALRVDEAVISIEAVLDRQSGPEDTPGEDAPLEGKSRGGTPALPGGEG